MYVPEAYGTPEEVAGIASVMRGGKYVLSAHMRLEGAVLVRSVGEVIPIAKRAGTALPICRFKAAGVAVTVDFHPYDRCSSAITRMPPPAIPGGSDGECTG